VEWGEQEPTSMPGHEELKLSTKDSHQQGSRFTLHFHSLLHDLLLYGVVAVLGHLSHSLPTLLLLVPWYSV